MTCWIPCQCVDANAQLDRCNIAGLRQLLQASDDPCADSIGGQGHSNIPHKGEDSNMLIYRVFIIVRLDMRRVRQMGLSRSRNSTWMPKVCAMACPSAWTP